MNKILSKIFIAVVTLYQYVISSVIPPSCRYIPSCSAYAIEAFKEHGAFLGGWLTIKRILRCNPFGGSGLDPVPCKVGCKENYEGKS